MQWGRRVPPHIQAALALERGERLVTWALGVDPREWAAASSWGLWLPGQGRLPWDGIDRAGWSPPVLGLTPAGRPPLQLRLGEPRDLPAVVRARVGLAVVLSRRQRLGSEPGAVRVVALRSPRTAQVRVGVRYEHGADPDALGVQEVVAQLRREVERDIGAGGSIGIAGSAAGSTGWAARGP